MAMDAPPANLAGAGASREARIQRVATPAYTLAPANIAPNTNAPQPACGAKIRRSKIERGRAAMSHTRCHFHEGQGGMR